QHILNPLVECPSGQPVERAEKLEVGARRQLIVERKILRHEADATLRGVSIARERFASDENPSAVGSHQAGNQRKSGGRSLILAEPPVWPGEHRCQWRGPAV